MLLAQALPAMILDNDIMWGGSATLWGITGMGLSISEGQTHLSGANLLLVACAMGTIANLFFLFAVIMGFSNSSAHASSLGGVAFAAALLSILFLLAGNAVFVPLHGCVLWLGAMLWLSIRSGLVYRRQLATIQTPSERREFMP
jgi:hypothetical protein